MYVVGTEHILIGLVREGDGVAARVLEHLGVSLGRLHEELARQVLTRLQGQQPGGALLSPEFLMATDGEDLRLFLSSDAKKALEAALLAAQELNPKLGLLDFIDTEHLLLGLLRKGAADSAVRLLKGLGVAPEQVRKEVMNYLGVTPSIMPAPVHAPETPKTAAKPSAYAQALALGIRVFEQSNSFPAEDICSLTADLLRASRAVCVHLLLPDNRKVNPRPDDRPNGEAAREIMRTLALLDLAAGYGYLAEDEASRLKTEYGELLNACTGS